MSKILVAGANGQLGRELVKLLGDRVVGADRGVLDIYDEKAVAVYCQAHQPSAIVNCAAYTAVDKAESDTEEAFGANEIGPKNLALAAKILNIPLIHISTDFIFDGQKPTPYTEEDAVNPLNIYGQSKLAGEKAVLATRSKSLIIRTGWVYSAHGKNFVKTMLHYGKERGHLRVVFDQIGTPTHAADLAAAIADILPQANRGYGQIFHYSNEGVASWYDFASAIIGLSDIACTIEPIEAVEYPAPAKRPAFSVLNKKKIKQTFKLAIPYWRESLKRCMKEINP
ncbi:MAG: dTDP-4-dehydrorhamnose reductase [Campylobacterales bacterium]